MYAGDSRRYIKVVVVETDEARLGEVVGLASGNPLFGVEAYSAKTATVHPESSSNRPDIVLIGLDSNPQASLAVAAKIVAAHPSCGLIIYGRAVSMDMLSQAMAAGARRYLPYPFDASTLHLAIKEVFDQIKLLIDNTSHESHTETKQTNHKKIISVFSPKGGVGTTTLAVNLAGALVTMGRRVVMIDGDISFGNVGVFFNLVAEKSILDLIEDPKGINEQGILDVLQSHESGMQLLLAPKKPEEADSIAGEHLRQVISILATLFDYVIIDTWPVYDERVLAMLDASDLILAPSGPELPSIKNLKMFMRVAELLSYPPNKVVPVLMRSNSVSAENVRDIETFLNQDLAWRVVSDGRRVTQAVNSGKPFVFTEPNAPVSQDIFALARLVDGQPQAEQPQTHKKAEPQQQSIWKRFKVGRAH